MNFAETNEIVKIEIHSATFTNCACFQSINILHSYRFPFQHIWPSQENPEFRKRKRPMSGRR